MYCLDTNIIIEFLKGNKIVISKLNEIWQKDEIFITTISLCELYKGIYISSKLESELNILDEFLNSISIINFSKESCKLFGETFSKLQKIGKTTNEFDLMISSIVKSHNLILITKDKKHFENTGISIEVW